MTGHLDIRYLGSLLSSSNCCSKLLMHASVMQCFPFKFIEINPIKLPFQTLQLTTNKENKKAIILTGLGGL
jgi:hypothetical protein